MISYNQWRNRKLWLEFVGPNGQISSDSNPVAGPQPYASVNPNGTQAGMAIQTQNTSSLPKPGVPVKSATAVQTPDQQVDDIAKKVADKLGAPGTTQGSQTAMTPTPAPTPMRNMGAGRNFMYPR